MDLLVHNWIPVRPMAGGIPTTISLQTLLCSDEQWILCLPRDDMELSALQLLVCLTQVIWTPQDDQTLRLRIKQPLTFDDFVQGISAWSDTFQLDHPDMPFMQFKGVSANDVTSMDKLLAGLTGATNCTFINEPGQGDALCGGCTVIALFNKANNAPSFGGGFKSGLRGGAPVTTLLQAINSRYADLRTTIWLNVLTQPYLQQLFSKDLQAKQLPVWQEPIQAGATIPATHIGLLRGLFWQPNHIELCPPVGVGQCSGCGQQATQRYTGFLKEKFNFSVEGIWPHPHSPRVLQVKQGVVEEKFLAFTTSAPSWTQISRLLVSREADKKEGHRPAAVVDQSRSVFSKAQMQLIVGGYRNNQASILERRHDVMVVNQGWQTHPEVINEVVGIGLGYKTALRKALYIFAEGIKENDIKGAGIPVHEKGEREYYRQSDLLIPNLLASIDFTQADEYLEQLKKSLNNLCINLFKQMTAPYRHHPKLVKALAIARRSLHKQLTALSQPQGE
ncbi:type I-E CRISPR-associated protein Cse1/CasA [Xenorhabdus ehlersii]|uniref:CRISPR-associated Cse1 family protein n=1 Tax=Xenorhabdus ehlersii TaxID=290111 RepID=A0A2D0IPQ8_9GAMM|nr:type I-E CRISPR-associated protein Cse1/CasA [Xenorhabdus ehlersii]PHM23804.1 type I-E CRISPR-associated protein Cse1/CasA [Xenorhabdus ehlersii]RKE89230.1 CRISPR-associated Cse1 family protein [Xenorhabdus ehlersii]